MQEPGRAPLSERVCEAACLGFALWTLCAHAVVAAGGSLRGLVALYALTGAALLALLWRTRRSRASSDAAVSPEVAPREAEPARAEAAEPQALRFGFLAAGAGAALASLWLGDPVVTWLLLVGVLGAAAVVFLLRSDPAAESPLRSLAAERGLWLLGVACSLYALVVHRPDADDSFYVNLAIAAMDRPELPLLARDTLHGRFDLPIHFPSYRLHSWELWNAAIGWLSGLSALHVFHLVSAAAAALLVPLAHAALFRRLTPRCWPFATLALVVVLVAAGETHRWYGNFALVRIWQGKAICLFVFTPLVYAFALRFAQRGDAASWLRLAAAQVGALGCSATALWSAPLAAGLAMLCASPRSVEGLRRLALGALASGYPIAAGVLLKAGMSASLPDLPATEPGAQLDFAFAAVLGEGRLRAVAVASLFVAFACCPKGLARRFAIAVPLAALVLLFAPWLDAWVRAHVTGPWFWRAMWALPIPILLALVCASPVAGALSRDRRARAACLALVAAFAIAAPRVPGWSERNAVTRIGWPGAKLPEVHRWAAALNELAPGQRVVAPDLVSAWIPVTHGHAYPMVVRIYLDPLRERVGEIAYRDRVLMTRFAGGNAEHPRAAAIFERGLELYDVQAACVENSEHLATAREILRRSGFVKRIQGTDMEVWSRAEPGERD